MTEQFDIKKLQRPLDISEIDFRVGEIKGQKKPYATILAYKDARVDMTRLDEATGGLWQNEYRRDSKNVLQCGIGIKMGDEWVWKWSCGTPSNFEAEKGEYSDAFKRAGFMWGIGRELYDYPFLMAALNDDECEKTERGWKARYTLKPNEWDWKWEGRTLIGSQNGKVRITGKAEDDETDKPDVSAAVALCSTVDALNALYAQLNASEKAKWKPEFTKRKNELENNA